MKKLLIFTMTVLMGIGVYAFGPGNIDPESLKKVGVSEENIKIVEKIVESKRVEFKKSMIEVKQKDLELDKILLEENVNWTDVEKLVKELYNLKAEHRLELLKTKKEIEKYITPEQYRKAMKNNKMKNDNKKGMKNGKNEQRRNFGNMPPRDEIMCDEKGNMERHMD